MNRSFKKAASRDSKSIDTLVRTIRRSGRRIDFAYGRLDAIRGAQGIATPKVFVGYFIGNDGEKDPFYAYSHDGIDEYRRRHAAMQLCPSTPWHQRIAFVLAGNVLHAKLQRQIETTELRERQTGAARWRERWQGAVAEYRSAISQFLKQKPRNAFELNLKISFLASLFDRDLIEVDEAPKAIRNLKLMAERANSADTSVDPIIRKIEAHRGCRDAWGKSFRTHGDNGDPALEKADRAAWDSLVATKPVTVAGAAALLDYLISVEGECIKGTGDTLRVIRTVSNALSFVSMSRAVQ